MVEHITPYNLQNPAFSSLHVDPNTLLGLGTLNHIITNQVSMIAYIDDYQLMMALTIAVIPLLLLLRPVIKPKRKKEIIVME